MQIHFTWGATDLIDDGSGAMIVPLLDGSGRTRVSCLHLAPGVETPERIATHGCALLVVHGCATVWRRDLPIGQGWPSELSGGVGDVVEKGVRFRVCTKRGAILMVVECQQLEHTPEGISHPQRIRGQLWPGKNVGATESY